MYTCSRSYRKNFKQQKSETQKKKRKIQVKQTVLDMVEAVVEVKPAAVTNIYLAKYFKMT